MIRRLHPLHPLHHPASPSPLAGVLVTGSLLALGVLCIVLRIPVADALVEAVTGVSGTEWRPPAAYPPFAGILFTPAAWLPPGVLKAVFVLGNAGLLSLLILLSCRLAGLRPRPGPVLAATIAGLWVEPLFQGLLPGQVSLALACLVLWDLGRREAALGKGFALGTAAGITLTPAVFIPYLLLTGRVRAGLTALAAFTGTGLLGLLVLPRESAEFWDHLLGVAGPGLLLYWPHLWVWAVPLLAFLTRAIRALVPVPAAARVPAGGPVQAGGSGRAGGTAPRGVRPPAPPPVQPVPVQPVQPQPVQSAARSSSASMIR
ncbi:glycosyltransferase family 87 protein [Streptomyces sp. NPDC090445]|uniref:glycosyltransferase family 87 protein n=1 Tax=Streptomyces sp. NPDC090445 TaxID=3365963 RepID=UPI0037F2A6B8